MSQIRILPINVAKGVASLLLAGGILALLTPQAQQLLHCSSTPSVRTCDSLEELGLSGNRYVLVNQFHARALRHGLVMSEGSAGGYAPLVPLDPDNATLSDAALESLVPRVILRIPPGMEGAELEKQLASKELRGIVRRPRIEFSSGFHNEDEIIRNWTDSGTGRSLILTLTKDAPIRWSDMRVWGVLALLLALTGYGTGVLAIECLKTPWQAGVTLMLLVPGLVWGIFFVIQEPAGGAVWNTAAAALALDAVLISVVGAALVACRLATLGTRAARAREASLNDSEPNAPPFEPTAAGFILRDERGCKEYTDASITGISSCSDVAVDGTGSRVRLIRLRVEDKGESEVIRLSDVLEAKQRDPLAPFVNRIIESLTRRARADLQSGGECRGGGWSLSLGGLELTEGDRVRVISPHAMTAAEWVGDEFCIWTAEDDRAVVRIPTSSENVAVLVKLLPGLLPRRSARAIPADTCGRMLLQIESGRGLTSFAGRRSGIIGFETALRIYSGGRETMVSLGMLEAYAIALNGENATVQLWCAENSSPLRVELSGLSSQALSRLEYLERHLADSVAKNLLRRLAEGGDIAWSNDVVVRLDGLLLRETGRPRLVPYSQVVGIEIDAEVLSIHFENGDAVQVPRSERNALAGMMLVSMVHSAVSDLSTSEPEQDRDQHAEPRSLAESLAV